MLCHPLLLLPSIFPNIRILSNELALGIRWPKNWSFSISPFNEYSGLISFRMDWFDLLEVQQSLKGLLQQHSSKASMEIRNLCVSAPCASNRASFSRKWTAGSRRPTHVGQESTIGCKNYAQRGARTHDPEIKSLMLYRLS